MYMYIRGFYDIISRDKARGKIARVQKCQFKTGIIWKSLLYTKVQEKKCQFSRRYDTSPMGGGEGGRKKSYTFQNFLSCYINRTELRHSARTDEGRYWSRDEEGATFVAPIGRSHGWGMRRSAARRIFRG